MLVGLTLAANDSLPGECVDAVDEDPDADDGDQPITCVTDVFPQLHEADVEGQQHHHNGNNTEDEEQVIQPLLGPLHSAFVSYFRLSAIRRQNDS